MRVRRFILLQMTMITIATLVLLLPIIGTTETLVIPDISSQPENSPDTTPLPARAMTMDQVRDEFGAPSQIMGPVGDPPITRWIYNGFVVTFESEYVINSAARRK